MPAPFGEIGGLYAKFKLLIDLGYYADWDAIGKALDVKGKTVQSWGPGGAKQRRNWVPMAHQPKLAALFGKAFPDSYGQARIEALIIGPLSEMERALRAMDTITLPELIDKEGRRDACEIFVEGGDNGLVTRRGRPIPIAQATIGLGSAFRLAFRTAYHGTHTYALQHVDGVWAPMDSNLDPSAGLIHLPGWDDHRRPDFMVENRHPGPHRFVVLQTRTPAPLSLEVGARQSSVLDLRSLEDLVRFYRDHKPTERRLFYVDIAITKPER